jgi:hypothetical protein
LAQTSSWRVSDAVAYDLMRADAAALCRLLLDLTSRGGSAPEEASSELVAVRRATVAVDGYDRRAVDDAAARFRARATELAGELDG